MSDAADTGSLDMDGAASAFEAIENPQEAEQETPETAAERLAAEEVQGKQDQDAGDDSDEQESEDAPEPDAVTIEVDGKPVKMTKAELAEAVKGQMRQVDYTQKTMAAAEVTKAAQAEKETAAKERAELAQKLNVYTIQAQGNLQHIEAQLTDELLHSDPVEYLALERTLRNGQAQLVKAQQDLQAINEQHQNEQKEANSKFIHDQLQVLLAKVPEWKDEEKMKAEMGNIEKFMGVRGFTVNDARILLDARTLLLARDAMKYRDLMERAGKAATKVAAAPPKIERPGVAAKQTSAQDSRTKQISKLGKSGKVSDAAAIFADMF